MEAYNFTLHYNAMIKTFSIVLLCGVLMWSCSNNSQPSTPDNSQVEDSDAPNPHDAMTARPMKSDEFYQDLLEEFCKKYYSKKFPKRSYVEGSLHVDNVAPSDGNTFVVMGTHTFKGRLGVITYKNKEFKATVREDGDDLYHIRFDRRQELIGHEWVTTGDLPFNYDGGN